MCIVSVSFSGIFPAVCPLKNRHGITDGDSAGGVLLLLLGIISGRIFNGLNPAVSPLSVPAGEWRQGWNLTFLQFSGFGFLRPVVGIKADFSRKSWLRCPLAAWKRLAAS